MSNKVPDDWSGLPGRLVILSGPSGSGKSTIAKRLFDRLGGRLQPSISMTTRPPRQGEVNNVDYIFLTPQEFEAHKPGLLEYAMVHGHAYGTPAEPARNLARQGVFVLLVIDVQGGFQVKQKVPSAISIFLEPPSLEILEQRLRARGTEDPQSITRRLETARTELGFKERYDHRVTNDDLDQAVAEITSILSLYGCRKEQNP